MLKINYYFSFKYATKSENKIKLFPFPSAWPIVIHFPKTEVVHEKPQLECKQNNFDLTP